MSKKLPEMSDQVGPYNISRTRVKIGEAKDPSELIFPDTLEELASIQKGEHPAYQYRLVIEFYPKTGLWVLFREQAYRPEYGGEIIQERTLRNLMDTREILRAWANTDVARDGM